MGVPVLRSSSNDGKPDCSLNMVSQFSGTNLSCDGTAVSLFVSMKAASLVINKRRNYC